MTKKYVCDPIQPLIDLISRHQKNGITIAEIGVFDGSTTRAYADIVKKNNGKIYAVDWFKGNYGAASAHLYNESNYQLILNQFKINLHEYLDIVDIKDGKSEDMIPLIPDESLDICFIDADHGYDNVYSDIRLCIPKVKKGGILCGHDFESFGYINQIKDPTLLNMDMCGIPPRHAGVIQAVFDHFGFDIGVVSDGVWIKQM